MAKVSEERRAVRQNLSRPLVDDLLSIRASRLARLSRAHDLVEAANYMLKRWPAFTLFLEDGRVCLSNNAAEPALRGIALGRKSWLFCSSDRGGQRAAAMYSLIITAKMNGVDPLSLRHRNLLSSNRCCSANGCVSAATLGGISPAPRVIA